MSALKRTGLYDLHVELGGKMVPFAGWELPVQYPMGVLKEHLHSRAAAGLFDVSHMGQVICRCEPEALEALMPVDVIGLPEGRQRYGLLTNDDGGILDDLMFANRGDHVFLVVNAANADADIAHLKAALGDAVEPLTDRALLALQGPEAEAVLSGIVPTVSGMRFMDVITSESAFGDLWISRSGYTGDDGFEISVRNDKVEAFARALLAQDAVAPIGLGARDSLRLEAGLPLHGHELTPSRTPVESGLGWAISRQRRPGGDRAGGFPGAGIILDQLENGTARTITGLIPEGRAPMREGTWLFDAADADTPVGQVTSGGFAPSLGHPVSIADLPRALAGAGQTVYADLRGKRLPATTTRLPFRAATFKR